MIRCLPLVAVAALAVTTMPTASASAGTSLAAGVRASGPCATGQVARSASYVFALRIGALEAMYTRAQVAAKHPKTGEVMLSGTMADGMAGMNMSGGDERHLEVHICTTAGSVVTGAHPTIVVADPSAKTMTTRVPIATMEGVGEGTADYHYGNNVALVAGHHISVTVTLDGQTVVFHTVVPKTSM